MSLRVETSSFRNSRRGGVQADQPSYALCSHFLLTKTQSLSYYSVMRYTFLLNSCTEYWALEEETGALRYAKTPL
jgi:hypothetical protein